MSISKIHWHLPNLSGPTPRWLQWAPQEGFQGLNIHPATPKTSSILLDNSIYLFIESTVQFFFFLIDGICIKVMWITVSTILLIFFYFNKILTHTRHKFMTNAATTTGYEPMSPMWEGEPSIDWKISFTQMKNELSGV